MAVKYSIQGLLIYATMAVYLFALVLRLLRRAHSAQSVFCIGFIISAASIIWRGFSTTHIPLRNLFEVFLFMASAVYLISVFSRRFLNAEQTTSDILIGFIILFPAGFVFSEQLQQLPPALQSPFFIPHVAAYLLAYVFMFKAGVAAGYTLYAEQPDRPACEQTTYRLISFGFPLLTLGLVLGSIWAQYAWADFWGWDPKEMWSLVTWLVYVGYFHFRSIYKTKYPRANSVLAIAGLVAVIITLLWVNLSRLFSGLHSYAV